MAGPDDNDELEEGIEETEESTEETEETEESTEGIAPNKSEKRIRDLQSKADAAEARANKAEAALRAGSADKGEGVRGDPATQALMSELREASLDAIYGEYPVLKQYGVERSLIEGGTRTEMREAATSVSNFIKTLSTKVRNEVLSEHGLKAEPAGSTRKAPVDYASMTDEAFTKLLDSM